MILASCLLRRGDKRGQLREVLGRRSRTEYREVLVAVESSELRAAEDVLAAGRRRSWGRRR